MNITTLSVEELYTLNQPLRAKLDSRQLLTIEEMDLHEAICAEVLARLDAQRLAERIERDERLAERYQHRPAQTSTSEETSGLNTFYSGIDN